MNKSEENLICEKIIGCSYKIATSLGSGFLEKVYENAMVIELKKQELIVEQQKSLQVFYEKKIVGEYFCDLFVENEIIVELKTAKIISDVHTAQLLNYLKACKKRVGLIINFANPKVEIKRVLNGF